VDVVDFVMLLFFLIIPIALIVCAVFLVRTKRALARAESMIQTLQARLVQLEAANNAKNGNQPNRL